MTQPTGAYIPPMPPLQNGKDVSLFNGISGLPNMQDALEGLMQPVVAEKVLKQIFDGRVQETVCQVASTQAVKQPFTARQLSIRPEGQRAWPWFTIHIKTDFILKVDEIFKLNGIRFRVMEVYNFSEYGYMQYSVVQGYCSEDMTA